MALSRRRGRPKKKLNSKKDKGTAQLRAKKKYDIMSEPLDVCEKRGLITEEQHIAGMRFRWLYTIKFGTPTVAAYNFDELAGYTNKYQDSKWLARRQKDYKNIMDELKDARVEKITMNICVFNQSPKFLFEHAVNLQKINYSLYDELHNLIEGLNIIDRFLKKNVAHKNIYLDISNS